MSSSRPNSFKNRRKEIGIRLVEVDSDSGDGQRSRHRRDQQFPTPKFVSDDFGVTLAEARADPFPDASADCPEVRDRCVDDPVEEVGVWLVDVAVERVEFGVGVVEHVFPHHVEVDLAHLLMVPLLFISETLVVKFALVLQVGFKTNINRRFTAK